MMSLVQVKSQVIKVIPVTGMILLETSLNIND